MTFSNAPSASKKYACSSCIGDSLVAAEIDEVRQRRVCSYCSRRRNAVSLEELAERVDEVYREIVHMAEETPHVTEEDDNAHWRRDGEYPGTIISELLEADHEDIGTDLADMLSAGTINEVHDGGFDPYEQSDIWEINVPRDPEYKQTWENFCHAIKHSRRFFNEQAAALLHSILGPLTGENAASTKSAIRTISPGDADATFYRGREANTRESQNQILADPIASLGAPPTKLNRSGRMNSAGIPVFYGSFDAETCVAELRCPVGGAAVVGKFELIRPIRVLDLTLLNNAGFGISYFDPSVIQKVAYNRFIRGFHKEIRKAIVPGSETLEYLPTQFVAEYLWSKPEPALDGIIFGSAQISKRSSRNIVLFPRSSVTAPVPAPVAVPTAGQTPITTTETSTEVDGSDEITPQGELEVTDEMAIEPEHVGLDFVDFTGLIENEPGPDPTLRFLSDDTVVVSVKSIRFRTESRASNMLEYDDLFSDPDEDSDEYYDEDE